MVLKWQDDAVEIDDLFCTVFVIIWLPSHSRVCITLDPSTAQASQRLFNSFWSSDLAGTLKQLQDHLLQFYEN